MACPNVLQGERTTSPVCQRVSSSRPFAARTLKPGPGPDLRPPAEFCDMIARRTFRPIIGNELSQGLAGEVLAEPAVFYPLLQTASHEMTIHVIRWNTALTLGRVIRALATIVPTEAGFCVFHSSHSFPFTSHAVKRPRRAYHFTIGEAFWSKGLVRIASENRYG
jgi:hypothetical protein